MRIGIVSTGKIAHKMASTILKTEGCSIEAVASRSLEKAEAFKEEFGISKAYGSYEELFEDENVDLVYIGTPHSTHKAVMLEAISHKKNILCEKAFTVNMKEALEVFKAAEENGVLVTEAIWTRYMPYLDTVKALLPRIGKVTSIGANLGYTISEVERIRSKALGGGALLDIGIYPINFALMVHPVTLSSITGSCVKIDTGVDIRDNINFTFTDGVTAALYVDAEAVTNRRGYINGTEGSIEIENINCPECIRLYSNDRNPILIEEHPIEVITGYEFQLLSCKKALEDGLKECPEMPHMETLRVLSVMDALRKLWDIKLSDE